MPKFEIRIETRDDLTRDDAMRLGHELFSSDKRLITRLTVHQASSLPTWVQIGGAERSELRAEEGEDNRSS
jgi:hypothetical protein